MAVLQTMFAVLSHARVFLAMKLFHVTKTIIRPTKARFTLSGCVYDPIHIRFRSASLQYESLRLHWADRYFLCARARWSLARSDRFSFLSQSLNDLVSKSFSSIDNAVRTRKNVFSMSSLFSKAVLLSRTSSFPPYPGLSQPNSEESVVQMFPSYLFLLTRFSSSKSSFLLAFRQICPPASKLSG